MSWQLVRKATAVKDNLLILYRKKTKYSLAVDVYLPKIVRNQIPNCYRYKWVNVYKKDRFRFLFQLTPEATSPHSRRLIRNNRFVLPWSLLSEFWPDGDDKMTVRAELENNNIFVDMRDLKSKRRWEHPC